MAEGEPIRCLAVVQLGGTVRRDRLQTDIPAIMELFKRLTRGEYELAFRSADGSLFGLLLKTTVPLFVIRTEFGKLTATGGEDSILVIEVGSGFDGAGFSRAWTWLQHH